MMHLELIIAIVGTGIAIIGVILAMMFWVRTESNSLRLEAKDDRKDLLQLVYAIQLEMKDFHHQLCKIEQKRNCD